MASPTGTARMPTQGSCRPLVAISVSSPRTSTVRLVCKIELVGLTAKRRTMSWPDEMPPSTPPAWFDRNWGPSSPRRISSALSAPVMLAAAKPAPISTPFTALMLMIALAEIGVELVVDRRTEPGGNPLGHDLDHRARRIPALAQGLYIRRPQRRGVRIGAPERVFVGPVSSPNGIDRRVARRPGRARRECGCRRPRPCARRRPRQRASLSHGRSRARRRDSRECRTCASRCSRHARGGTCP